MSFQGSGASSAYGFDDPDCGRHHDWLLPPLAKLLDKICPVRTPIFDLGCGNGSVANWLTVRGHEVIGVDESVSGIAVAKKAYPTLRLEVGSAYDELWKTYGKFPVVVSLEVIEHVYFPRHFAACIANLLPPDGTALISTPYHGYFKNVALALTGQMDAHFTALWDHGHIKFWSPRTLTALLAEAGLTVREVRRVGRVPALAKSMIVVASKS